MLYPLRFQPIFRRYLWGGRRLATILSKPLGAGDDYAESWEIVDHGPDQSIVQAGSLAGTSLRQLMADYRTDLLGTQRRLQRFPLLFKFLDCHRALSVQVHPNDAQAALADPPDLGKTEAWVILHADPDSYIYAGLQLNVNRPTLEVSMAQGMVEACLHRLEPKVGDCLFIPAGLVHALGEGLVVAEIQQSSDTTYRLFDWNRKDASGNPRPLHVQQALDCIDYQHGPASLQCPKVTDEAFRQRLVQCDQFVLDRIATTNHFQIGGDDRFHLLAVLSGSLAIDGDPCLAPLSKGNTMLLPASLGKVHAQPQELSTILDIYLP